MIVPAPLLLIHNRDSLTMHGQKEDGNGEVIRDKNNIVGTQLIMNYCFGHKESSLLLCPASNAILSNHCSPRQVGQGECGVNGQNAEYRWSSGWDPETPKLLQMPLEDLSGMSRGPSLEIFATRDIKPGEEIFMDYGQEWEEAWNQYMQVWTPPEQGRNFVDHASATSMNSIMDMNSF